MAVGTENVATTVVDENGEIQKSRADKREYRRIVLKNSLQVLLISDPETDKCAASMNVSIGSFSDPEGLEGLAHFLEHMLFYASEKYPEEYSFSKYITEHGGSTNAYTSSEDTNYHFDINTDSFDEALDRFAQFFIKPLMSADATMRAIKAVDSENKKNLLTDSCRRGQLLKHLTREDHPYHKFSTGNMDTLHVRPEAKGIDTRSELIKFYDEHYSASIMHLVVYGKENLDITQCLVEELFEEIRNTNKGIPSVPGQPCTPDHLQVLVKAVPITQGHMLSVSWPVTPSIHHYEEAPWMYLSHLIGHEGEGSLFHALKILGWATGLCAGEGDWSMEYSFFDISIILTDIGHEHMQDILGLVFKHIKLLQNCGVSQWFFEELSAISEALFHYEAKRDPIDHAVAISANMAIYPTKHWVVGSLLSKFNPAILQKYFDELSSNNEMVTKAYQYYKFDQPNEQAMYYCSLVLQDQMGPWTEEQDALSHLEAEDLTKFVPKLLSRTFVECYVAGNVEKEEAESMVKHIEEVLFNDPKPICRPLLPSKFRTVELGRGTKYFYHQEGSNPSDENSALVHYIQVAALRGLTKEEFIDIFDEYIKVDAPKKKSLSICIYGSKHLNEMTSDKEKVVSPFIEIDDIVDFRKSHPLYSSLKGSSQLKL